MKREENTFPAAFTAVALLVLTFVYAYSFGYPFVTSKWLSFYGLAVLAWGYLCKNKEFYYPRISAFGVVIFLALLGSIAWTVAQKVPQGYEAVAADRIGFLAFVLFFYGAFSAEKIAWASFFPPALIAIAGVSLIGLAQALTLGLVGQMPYFSMAATMGHTNNAAQWVAALLCLVVPFLPGLEKKNRVLACSIVLVSLFYIFLTRARSVWIAVILGALFLGWRHRRDIFGGLKKHILIFSGAFLALAGAVVVYGGSAFWNAKASMSLYRATIWKATMSMILDQPLGFGPDQFEFWHLPYIRGSVIVNYNFIARSPHNEFLRYLVEDGVVISSFIALLLGMILVRFFKNGAVSFREKNIVVLFLLFFGVESFFQFPFQTSQTVFLFAALIGYMLVKGFPAGTMNQRKVRPFLLLCFLVSSVLAIKIGYSHLHERSDDYESVARACDWFPANWNACFRKGGLEVKAGDLAAARKTLERALEMSPYNHYALRNLSTVAFMEGKSKAKVIEGCYYLWKHNFLFGKQSPLYDYQFNACDKKLLDYLDRKRPEKFFGRQF